MLNLTNMVRAPVRDFEVTMHRRASLNDAQNARKCVAYVRAINADEAKMLANRLPDKQAFKAKSAREVK